MRAILLLGIVSILCVIALIRPKIGVLAYTWFALMRPDYLSWSAGHLPLLRDAGLFGAGRLSRFP